MSTSAATRSRKNSKNQTPHATSQTAPSSTIHPGTDPDPTIRAEASPTREPTTHPDAAAAHPATDPTTHPDTSPSLPHPDEPEPSTPQPDPTESWATLEHEVAATAGHGPARAAAMLAIAEAFGAVGVISGSTRSTGPDEGVFLTLKVPEEKDVRVLEDIFSAVTERMEEAAKARRAKTRDELKAEDKLSSNTYTLNLASRSTMVGYGQGVGSVLAKARGYKVQRPEGALSPVAAARFRKHNLDDSARRSGMNTGRRFAEDVLLGDERLAITDGK
jgi:hypothetical protein